MRNNFAFCGEHRRTESGFDVVVARARAYFKDLLEAARAYPLLWTTGLMAPEAYTLAAALESWIAGDPPGQVRRKVALAYDRFQHCGLRGAHRLFEAVYSPVP